MAVSRWSNVICDVEGPNCEQDPYMAYTDNLTQARAQAKAHGWARRANKDVCPGCNLEDIVEATA